MAALKSCLLKYCCEGQYLAEGTTVTLADAPLHVRYRKQIGILIPFTLTHWLWWSNMMKYDSFGAFTNEVGTEKIPAFYMSITMIFGSMLAGATSEGGAAVAFPIMTLVFGIAPPVARDFSFMIQSVGMTAASFTILFMRVLVEWNSIIYCTLGGAAGVIFGLEYVAPELTPPYSKMYFVVIWGSFAASLYYLNRLHGRKVYLVTNPPHLPEVWRSADLLPGTGTGFILNWKALLLVCAGFLGGIFTSMSGSGIDICSFAVLTLVFRVSEKTATPTSVVLMGINTVIAMWWRQYGPGQMCGASETDHGLCADAWDFFVVCAPIVVAGAPLGSVLGSFLHRLVLAAFVYVTDAAQLIGALYVVQPWTREKCNAATDCVPAHLCWTSAMIFAAGLLAFTLMQAAGERIIAMNDALEIEGEKAALAEEREALSVEAAAEAAAAQSGLPNNPPEAAEAEAKAGSSPAGGVSVAALLAALLHPDAVAAGFATDGAAALAASGYTTLDALKAARRDEAEWTDLRARLPAATYHVLRRHLDALSGGAAAGGELYASTVHTNAPTRIYNQRDVEMAMVAATRQSRAVTAPHELALLGRAPPYSTSSAGGGGGGAPLLAPSGSKEAEEEDLPDTVISVDPSGRLSATPVAPPRAPDGCLGCVSEA